MFGNIVSKMLFQTQYIPFLVYSYSIKQWERKGKKENKRSESFTRARDSRTYTRIETQSFHRTAG